MLGDFVTDTGPGMANKMIRRGLVNNKNVVYSNGKNKITRIIEMFSKLLMSDCICLCSLSRANVIAIKLAKLLNKKTFYVMHGYSTYESQINHENIANDKLKRIHDLEKYIFQNVDKIFCVSEIFMKFMKNAEPDYADKFDYNYNGVDIEEIERIASVLKIQKKMNQIVSLGGGMRLKNNLVICQAINKLNQEKQLGLEYIVIGLPQTDKKQICSYEFVTYYDKLPHEKVLEILAESFLYIQNSNFETFGLAIIEAMATDCNLLISDNIGAIGVLKTIESSDLIFNTTDVDEIAEKIEILLANSNVRRLQQGLDRNEVGYAEAAELLFGKILDTWENSND